MKYKKFSRKDRVDRSSRRALAWGVLVFCLTFGSGLLIWIAVGQPHRHGSHWHWDKDKQPPSIKEKDETKHE